MELSFVDEQDIMAINEGLLARVMKEVFGKDLPLPLPKMPYQEAMARFGSDKPDTRFGMELQDLSEIAEHCGFKVFEDAVKNGGSVRAINAKQAHLSRKEIDACGQFGKNLWSERPGLD